MYLFLAICAIAVFLIAGAIGVGNTLNARVGPLYGADGVAAIDTRLDSHGADVVIQSGGKYKEATKRGNVYSAQTAATGVAPGTALGTTAAFCLHNPAGSNKRLIIQKLGMGVISGTLGAGTVHICSSSSGDAVPTGTAITPRPRDVGSSNASVAVPLTTATITTNAGKQIGILCSLTEQVVGTTAVNNEVVEKDIDGEIVIEPGFNITLHATAGGGSTPLVVFFASWEEESINA